MRMRSEELSRSRRVLSNEAEAEAGEQKPNITSSKPQSPLLSCLPFFHLDLNCFVQWQTSLALTSRPYIRRLFLFFLPPRFVYISALPNCSEPAFVLGFNVKFGPTCLPLFCSYRLPVELLMFRKPTKLSCFLEDIRVSFDCKQQISTKH